VAATSGTSAHLILNPGAGSTATLLESLTSAARERGILVRVLEPGEDARLAALEAADDGADSLVVAGGDAKAANLQAKHELYFPSGTPKLLAGYATCSRRVRHPIADAEANFPSGTLPIESRWADRCHFLRFCGRREGGVQYLPVGYAKASRRVRYMFPPGTLHVPVGYAIRSRRVATAAAGRQWGLASPQKKTELPGGYASVHAHAVPDGKFESCRRGEAPSSPTIAALHGRFWFRAGWHLGRAVVATG
jgi:hypothetical protein